MRYNSDVLNYKEYIDEIKKESKLQAELYKRIGITRNKIKRMELKMNEMTSQLQLNQAKKHLVNLNKDIDKYNKELEYSKARYRFFEQKVCAHDFGIIINDFVDSEGNHYNSGICLDCDAEINGKEAPIFAHSIRITDEISGAFNIEDYKTKLDALKKKYNYFNSAYDEETGEIMVNELYNEAKLLKKKYGRS